MRFFFLLKVFTIFLSFNIHSPFCYSMVLSEAEKNIRELTPKIDKLKSGDLYLLALSYEALSNFESALKIYRNIMSQNEKDYNSRVRSAFCLFKLKKDKEAIQLYKEAIDINKKREDAYLGLVQIYENKKNKYELRILYQDMLQNVGEKPIFFSKVCELSQQEGLYELTQQYCEQGMKRDTKSPKSFIHLALMKKDTGQVEDAKKTLELAIQKFPKSDEPKIVLAQIYEDKKSYIESLKLYKQAVEINELNSVALVGVANGYFELQNFSEALDFYLKACKIDRIYLPALRRSTQVLKKNKDQQEWAKKYENSWSFCKLN